ncbi:hypothetical protein Xen7305DRAFT_00008870 [Xenococcus sp. PCC 7305]|uniref:hypothetical protein n=1 Tax=Xenococcus sp. PCC 7305 TaxID=102125 RepID=UPI0002AD0F50|nr:hypothetical protein [Xenococcus sp. PCC 7305]ELS01185.1 hypothetical protein Xen7305DRAFT_00008870 [Xenococcus sp. PCC 7305]
MAASKPKKVGFLQEDNGNYSQMRLMCLLSLFAAIAFGGVAVMKDSHIGTEMAVLFAIGAFAPKALQKVAEQNMDKPTGSFLPRGQDEYLGGHNL